MVKNEDPSVVKTIMSVRELEKVQEQILAYKDAPGMFTQVEENYANIIQDIASKGLLGTDDLREASLLHAQLGKEMFSESHISELQAKSEALQTYLKKVGESTSFFNQITKGAITNLYTSDLLSPTSAALNYNKYNASADSVLSKANAYKNDILDLPEKIATLYSQKSEYLSNKKGIVNEQLKAQFIGSLKAEGFTDIAASAIWKPMSQKIHIYTTRAFLNVKNPDIQNVFKDIFGDIGVKVKAEFHDQAKSEGNSIAKIIMMM